MDLLHPMQVFVRVIEAGSFSAAAARLATTQPTISRQVAALEDHLGTRLLTRTTRSISLTEDGRAFYDHAQRILEAVGEAENSVGHRRAKPSGTLRLAAPAVFGRLHVIPLLPKFLKTNPDVAVDLVMSDSFVDLADQGIDLAIRVGEITDPSLIARRIGKISRVVVASPDYLRLRGVPRTPTDLASHDCIVYTRLATGSQWAFQHGAEKFSVDVAGRYRADNSEAVREGVLAGLGIALIPQFAFSSDIRAGRVKLLLSGYQTQPLPMSTVYLSRKFVPLKVRAMINFLAKELPENSFGSTQSRRSSGKQQA